MKTKSWINSTIIITLFTLIAVCLINYTNDPLWNFNNNNFSNKERIGFNERQQKTNQIYFTDKKYDSVLVGNSKASYINQNSFNIGRLYNYSVSAMNIKEYEGYINFFKASQTTNPKYIILALDFMACTNNKDNYQYNSPNYYISNTTSFFYRFKSLLSYNTLVHSARNIAAPLDTKRAVYLHDKKKIKIGFDNKWEKKHDKKYVTNNPKIVFPGVSYNNKIPEIFTKLKDQNRSSKIFVIFLPDILPFFTINKNKAVYEKCVSDLQEIFGENNIVNFMKINDITLEPNNYYDGSHFRSHIGDIILSKIEDKI